MECVVCGHDVTMVQHPCMQKHSVCTLCLAEWQWTHTNCPVCRTELHAPRDVQWIQKRFETPRKPIDFLVFTRRSLGLQDHLEEWWDKVRMQDFVGFKQSSNVFESRKMRMYFNHALCARRGFLVRQTNETNFEFHVGPVTPSVGNWDSVILHMPSCVWNLLCSAELYDHDTVETKEMAESARTVARQIMKQW